jgi:hypothetical protein
LHESSGRPCVSVSRGSIREVVELKADGLTIGREASDFIIDDPRVSLHLRLELVPISEPPQGTITCTPRPPLAHAIANVLVYELIFKFVVAGEFSLH